MVDLIFGSVVVVLVGSASRYIYKEKKSGTKCIGCPLAGKEGCHCKH